MAKLTQQQKILADVDDEIYSMVKKLQEKHQLTWTQTREKVNYSLRSLMLAFPEEWLKK